MKRTSTAVDIVAGHVLDTASQARIKLLAYEHLCEYYEECPIEEFERMYNETVER